jgi:hypothetical protein
MTPFTELYERRQNQSIYWFNKSSDLHTAAGALWYSRDESRSEIMVKELGLRDGFHMDMAVTPVYYMLCGLSLELLYKAIIVAKGSEFKRDHKLVALATLAGIDPDHKLKGLLEMLTEFIEWYGKYPVPKRYQQLEKTSNLIHKHLYDSKQSGNLHWAEPNDALSWQSFDSLWREGSRLYWEYYFSGRTKAGKGQDGP